MIDWKNTLVKCETTSDVVDFVRFLTELGYYLEDETIDEFAESLCVCYPSENMRLDYPYSLRIDFRRLLYVTMV